MNELIQKWLDNQFTAEDVIPAMLYYDSLYNDGKLTPTDVMKFLMAFQFPLDSFIEVLMQKICKKENILVYTLYDKNGKLLKRYV